MGILDGIIGNATEVDAKNLEKEFAPVLTDGETIERAFQIVRDMFIFTSKRLILVDRQGMSGKKVEYHSIPYSSITQFSVETAGSFDRDAELRIWLRGQNGPLQRELKKGVDIIGVQKTLAHFVLA